MKLLGHAWVAVKTVPKGVKEQLILGSVIPEIMFYTKNHPFDYKEIHEGGPKVLSFIRKENPKMQDFALGMISHSFKWGADKFNLDDNLTLLGYKGSIARKIRHEIVSIMGVSKERSMVLAHNLLELAVDLTIIKENPKFVEEFVSTLQNKDLVKEVKNLLSESFGKPLKAVSKSVDELIQKAKPEYFSSALGLAKLWSELETDDPDFDTAELATFLEKLNKDFEGREKIFLTECIKWTTKNIQNLLNST